MGTYLNMHVRGFNLVELMVVVAIVSILSGLSVPAYKDYLMKAKLIECMSYVYGWATKLNAYYAFYGDYPEDSFTDGPSNQITTRSGAKIDNTAWINNHTTCPSARIQSYFTNIDGNGDALYGGETDALYMQLDYVLINVDGFIQVECAYTLAYYPALVPLSGYTGLIPGCNNITDEVPDFWTDVAAIQNSC